MLFGITGGILWAFETIILGIALSLTPLFSDGKGVILAPFISTFIHDSAPSLCMWIFSVVKGNTAL